MNQSGFSDQDQSPLPALPEFLQPAAAQYRKYVKLYNYQIDRTAPHVMQRWLATVGLNALFLLRIVMAEGVSPLLGMKAILLTPTLFFWRPSLAVVYRYVQHHRTTLYVYANVSLVLSELLGSLTVCCKSTSQILYSPQSGDVISPTLPFSRLPFPQIGQFRCEHEHTQTPTQYTSSTSSSPSSNRNSIHL